MRALALLALAIATAGCPTATVGTIELGLTAAPGSVLLESVTRLRVTLTHPFQVVEASRGANGFAVALDVEATGESGAIIVEGFDVNGSLVAAGNSPEFGIAAIDARIVVYMSTPFDVARAPVTLAPARANVAGDRLPYGVIFAGGRDAANAPSDAVAIYNAFDHSLVGGKPLPAPRDGIVVASGASGTVSLFGGRDAAGNPTGTYWLFDTTFAPTGAYLEVSDQAGFARADDVAITIGLDKFVLTGTPAIEIAGATVTAHTEVAGLAPSAASFVTANGVRTALALEATTGRFVRFHDGVLELLAIARPGGAVAALPDGRFVVVGGGSAEEANDVLVVDATGAVTSVPDVLAAPRVGAHVAATRRHVVITGDPIEILDATTLAPVVTRAAIDGLPFALPNDQVLIVDRANGELSLFTPPPPGV